MRIRARKGTVFAITKCPACKRRCLHIIHEKQETQNLVLLNILCARCGDDRVYGAFRHERWEAMRENGIGMCEVRC